MIIFKRLFEEAILPKRSSDGSAGFDLSYIGLPVELQPGCYALFETGIQMTIPKEKVGIIKSRSGLALKYGIDVLAGVIDSDYTGEVKVILINHGKTPVIFRDGDRIAQLVVVDYMSDAMETTQELGETDRGTKGFGSSGR